MSAEGVAIEGARPVFCAEQYSGRGCGLLMGHKGQHQFFRDLFDGTQGLMNIYHAITGKHCERYVALGMATSAVSSLREENERLKELLGRAVKSIKVNDKGQALERACPWTVDWFHEARAALGETE